jgi:hypothetical protein
MRILITGYTTRMTVDSSRIDKDYITFSYLLRDILVEMGHEVECRKVVMGEDLSSQFGFAFCGVAPINSMTSSRICETHYAMDKMRGRHVVYADDWSFCGYGGSIRYALDRWDKFVKYKGFRYPAEIVESVRQSLENMVEYNQGNNAMVLAPMFPWGNHQFLMKDNYEAKLITVDPSAWLKFPTLDIPAPKDKIRQWVMAALSDHTPWIKKQKFKLPVKYVGNQRMGVDVLNETQTVRLFAQSFGVLSTGYPSAGSGWWRTRYLNAAWAESLIYSDARDAVTMGKAFQGSAYDFENIQSDTEYLDRVESQRIWLENNIATKEWVMDIMRKIIK